MSHDEIEENLSKELDFTIEAANGMRTRANFAHNDRMYVPLVYDEMSSTRVLTMEFIDGVKITDVARIRAMGIDVTDVLKETIRGVAEQIFLHGFVHWCVVVISQLLQSTHANDAQRPARGKHLCAAASVAQRRSSGVARSRTGSRVAREHTIQVLSSVGGACNAER